MGPAPGMQFQPIIAALEQSGVAASFGDQWSEAAICAAVARGLHTSALTPEALVLVEQEIQYQ